MFARRSLLQMRRIVARCEVPFGDVPRGGRCLNSVELIGYTGNDPVHSGTDERPVTRFPLGTTNYYRSKDDKLQSKTSWHNIVVFKPFLQEKVNAYVKRGTRVFLQGSLDYSNYIDQDGQKKFSCSIILKDVIILGGYKDNVEHQEEEY